MQLVIAEKPSVARNIAKVLHATNVKDGYLEGKEYLFEGVVNGTIIKEKKGGSGFGYDPIFMPDTYAQTFAEMGNDIKNRISHRAEAVKKLTAFLSDYTF